MSERGGVRRRGDGQRFAEKRKNRGSRENREMQLVKKMESAAGKMNRPERNGEKNEDGERGKPRGRLIFLRLNLHKTFITTNLGWGAVGWSIRGAQHQSV